MTFTLDASGWSRADLDGIRGQALAYLVKNYRALRADHEDLAQEVILKITQTPRADVTHVSAFVRTVTKNEAIDLLRRRKSESLEGPEGMESALENLEKDPRRESSPFRGARERARTIPEAKSILARIGLSATEGYGAALAAEWRAQPQVERDADRWRDVLTHIEAAGREIDAIEPIMAPLEAGNPREIVAVLAEVRQRLMKLVMVIAPRAWPAIRRREQRPASLPRGPQVKVRVTLPPTKGPALPPRTWKYGELELGDSDVIEVPASEARRLVKMGFVKPVAELLPARAGRRRTGPSRDLATLSALRQLQCRAVAWRGEANLVRFGASLPAMTLRTSDAGGAAVSADDLDARAAYLERHAGAVLAALLHVSRADTDRTPWSLLYERMQQAWRDLLKDQRRIEEDKPRPLGRPTQSSD